MVIRNEDAKTFISITLEEIVDTSNIWEKAASEEKTHLLKVIKNDKLKGSPYSISPDMVDAFIKETHTSTLGEKTTVVHAILVNGFEITETSSCVDAANYDEKLGEKFCIEKIKDKVWMFLGFMLQTAVNGFSSK